MRKFFTRLFATLRTAEWTSSLGQFLLEAEWVASTIHWFTRHVVVGAVLMFTGLSTGLIVAVRALDWSLILQWVVGVGWVVFCRLVFYKVNKKIESWTPKEEKEAVRKRTSGVVSIPTATRPAESAKVTTPAKTRGTRSDRQ